MSSEIPEQLLFIEELKRKALCYEEFVNGSVAEGERHRFCLGPVIYTQRKRGTLHAKEVIEKKGNSETGKFIGVVLGIVPAAGLKDKGMLDVIERYLSQI